MEALWGRDYTQLSATFNTVVHHIYSELSYLVTNNFAFFIPWLLYFKAKVQQKIAEKNNGVIPAELADVGLFLDGNVLALLKVQFKLPHIVGIIK